MICAANGIDHGLTKPIHTWTNGQVERMNRTTKEATVKRFHYDSHDQRHRSGVWLVRKRFAVPLLPFLSLACESCSRVH